MQFFSFQFLAAILFAESLSQAQQALPAKTGSDKKAEPVREDTVYVEVNDGIPWNRENFPRERMIRLSPPFDQALKVNYTYSVSVVGGNFGTLASQSYMAHLSYEFTPDLHLYADLGLWMPLYVNMPREFINKEDLRQGHVGFLLPSMALEYKPSENSYMRLQFMNERDIRKAYGPLNYTNLYCNPYRNSIFCR